MTQQTHSDYEDLRPSVGDRLRIARERRTSMDQSEFADFIGVSRGTVSHYERNKLPGGPRQRLVLNAWAAACGVTREWLEDGYTPNAPTPDPGPGTSTQAAPDALAKLTQEKRSRARHGAADSTQRYPVAA